MPFAMPSTYTSLGGTGYGSTFSIGSPLVPVLEVKSFDIDSLSIPEVNVTHLLSPNATEELRPGLAKPGMIQMSGNFIGDASQTGLLTMAVEGAQQNPQTQPFSAVAPMNDSTKTLTVTGVGYISKFKMGAFANGKPVDFECSVQISGLISINVT